MKRLLGGAAAMLAAAVIVACGATAPKDRLTVSSPQATAMADLAAQEKMLAAGLTAVKNAVAHTSNSGVLSSLSNAESDVSGAESENSSAASAISQIQPTTVTQTTTVTTTTATGTATTSTGTTTTPTPMGGENCAGAAASSTISQSALDSCGFPSMNSTGPAAGTSYTNYPDGLVITAPGTYNGLNVTGNIQVEASNVTIDNSQVTDADNNNPAINIANGSSGDVIENTSVHGTSSTGAGALFAAVQNIYGPTLNSVTLDHVQFYNGDRILVGAGTVTNSYCDGGATFGSEHDECVYTPGSAPGVTLVHDTLLNANPWQTAAVFVDSPTGCAGCSNGAGSITIENSILGGGAYTIYGGDGTDGSVHTGPEIIENNRFTTLWFSTVGQFGIAAYMPSDLQWSGNVYDATGQPIP